MRIGMKAAVVGMFLLVIGLCAGCGPQQVALDAGSATLHGDLKYSVADKVLCYWSSLDQSVTWIANVPAPGEYELSITYSCPIGDAGSEVAITIGDKVLAKTVNGSSGWDNYITETVGRVLLNAGEQEVKVTPTKKPGSWIMNMRQIILKKI